MDTVPSSSQVVAEPPPAPDELPRAAKVFAVWVIVGSLLVNLAVLRGATPTTAIELVVWTLFAWVSQIMLFPTPTGRADVSLGTCVHLCMALVLPVGVSIPSLWLSRAIAAITVQRKPWLRALFNAAQVTAAVIVATVVMRATGLHGHLEPTLAGLLRTLPGFLAGAAAYYVINMGAVSTVVARSTGRSAWAVWREDYGYAPLLVGTLGLALLAPITALTYQSFGPMGLGFFLLPMLLLWDSSRRYVTLRRTQEALVSAECLAARAGLAVEVGHAINNSLAAVHGQLQLLERSSNHDPRHVQGRVHRVLDSLARVDRLSKRLMDLSRRDTAAEPTAIAELLGQTASMLRYQKRFSDVRLEVDCDHAIGQVWVDPIQIQQALINLIMNATESMESNGTRRRVVTVSARLVGQGARLELAVADTGAGVPVGLRSRVFEPGFTTRPGGHGFGLTIVREIVRGHQGSLRVEAGPRGGAMVTMSLPVRGPALLMSQVTVTERPARDQLIDVPTRIAGPRRSASSQLRRLARRAFMPWSRPPARAFESR
jgi:signal transduction histidine kinase